MQQLRTECWHYDSNNIATVKACQYFTLIMNYT